MPVLLLGTESLGSLDVLHIHQATWPMSFQESTYVLFPGFNTRPGFLSRPHILLTLGKGTFGWLGCLPCPLQGVFFVTCLGLIILWGFCVRAAGNSWSFQQTEPSETVKLTQQTRVFLKANSEELTCCLFWCTVLKASRVHSDRMWNSNFFLSFYSLVVNGI